MRVLLLVLPVLLLRSNVRTRRYLVVMAMAMMAMMVMMVMVCLYCGVHRGSRLLVVVAVMVAVVVAGVAGVAVVVVLMVLLLGEDGRKVTRQCSLSRFPLRRHPLIPWMVVKISHRYP